MSTNNFIEIIPSLFEINLNTDKSGSVIFEKLSSVLNFDEGFIYFANPDSLQLKYAYKTHSNYPTEKIFPLNENTKKKIFTPEGEILSQREPTLIHRLEYSDEFLPLIQLGMKGVVDESGTAGKYFRNWPYTNQIAAKTGTAQVTSIDLENNAWFVCFAPYENPEIAIACFIPNGYSGSEASQAPRDFIEWYMGQKTLRSAEEVLPVGNSLAP